MLKYNMLTSHRQRNGIANRAQLSELRSENMYQRRLKRFGKWCVSVRIGIRICIIGRHAPTENFKEHPSRRFPRTRNVASPERIVYVLGMFYFNLCKRTCCYTLSVP